MTTISSDVSSVLEDFLDQEIPFDFDAIQKKFEELQFTRHLVKKSSARERIAKLRKLERILLSNKKNIREALAKDFSKPDVETDISETYAVLAEIRFAIKNLKKWIKSRKLPRTLLTITAHANIKFEPRGVVLIISPWNFPVNLLLIPLVSAIAAGNCAVLKPSELAPHTSKLLASIIQQTFQNDEIVLYEGGAQLSQALLTLPFDHVFFTGSPAVGKLVMEAAAKNLTSVTLELGGKSPTIIDETANVEDAAKKLVIGKFLNAGQTCIAPDYVLIHSSVFTKFVTELIKQLQKSYGDSNEKMKKSKDFARIINSHHFIRLNDLLGEALQGGALRIFGGELDKESKYISPTVLSDVPENAKIWQEEIFGPILLLKKFDELKQVIDIIRKQPKPLAMYIFSGNKKNIKTLLESTSAGGVCVNDTVLHFLQHNMPFGGVGASGMGSVHGFAGFRTFSHEKPVLYHHKYAPVKLLSAPYSYLKKWLVQMLLKYL